jgi:SAM-dependent methyltransferase
MERGYERRYHDLESHGWWFRGRRDAVVQLLRGAGRRSRILDVGCSGGALLHALGGAGFTRAEGIDISREAVSACRKRGIRARLMDGSRTEFADDSFDFVVASDVLEHIRDEHAALAEWARVLKPGGTLIVFVPAFMFLWSPHDDANRHFRRYSGSALRAAVARSGLIVERSSYWNSLLFLPAAVWRTALRGIAQKDDLRRLHPLLDSALFFLLCAENRLLGLADLPFGVSAFVIARKI